MQMKIGDKQNVAGFDFQLLNVVEGFRENYAYRQGVFEVFHGRKQLGNLEPEMRVYPVEKQATTEAAIGKYYLSDLYAVIGEKAPNGSYSVRLYFKPLVNLIWFGVIMMFIGGGIRTALNVRKSLHSWLG
jgi:cytochrome c-type biogenesis protein CcmF